MYIACILLNTTTAVREHGVITGYATRHSIMTSLTVNNVNKANVKDAPNNNKIVLLSDIIQRLHRRQLQL